MRAGNRKLGKAREEISNTQLHYEADGSVKIDTIVKSDTSAKSVKICKKV